MGLIYCILALRFYSGPINAIVCFLHGEGGSLKKLEKHLSLVTILLSYFRVLWTLPNLPRFSLLAAATDQRARRKETKETLRQLQ